MSLRISIIFNFLYQKNFEAFGFVRKIWDYASKLQTCSSEKGGKILLDLFFEINKV